MLIYRRTGLMVIVALVAYCFILRFFDDVVMASESEKYIWSSIGLFWFRETFNS